MIEMQKKYTIIICTDGTSLKCFVNLLPGQKLIDLIKNHNEYFILLNDVEINYQEQVQSFRLSTKTTERKNSLIINKYAIKWITEV